MDGVCNDKGDLIFKNIINRQCFSLKDNKCTLMKSHSYYYQIQMQLLVTERTLCDFVLYAKDEPVSIEGIYRAEIFITGMLNVLTEICEMRVLRDLLPFVMPSDLFDGLTLPAIDILSPAAACVNNEYDPEGTPNTDLPPAAASHTSPPDTIDSELPKVATSLLQYSTDELVVTDIVNRSLLSSVFPAAWKISEVIPLPKDGDHEIPNNNRPVSLLPAASKI